MQIETQASPKLRAVMLDDTHSWCEEVVRLAGGKVFGLYWYDESEPTCLCEFTPSYALELIESVPLVLPESDEERDTLWTALAEGDGQASWDCSYRHCHHIEALPETNNLHRYPPRPQRWELADFSADEWAEMLAESDAERWQILSEWVAEAKCNGVY